MTKVENAKKMIESIIRIIPKAHTHLQTMTSVKFKKDWLTTIKSFEDMVPTIRDWNHT